MPPDALIGLDQCDAGVFVFAACQRFQDRDFDAGGFGGGGSVLRV